jgi:hypothetical protein
MRTSKLHPMRETRLNIQQEYSKHRTTGSSSQCPCLQEAASVGVGKRDTVSLLKKKKTRRFVLLSVFLKYYF